MLTSTCHHWAGPEAYDCGMQRLSDHADVSSQGWTGSICGIPACITRPLSHCRKLISCQLAIFLPLKSLIETVLVFGVLRHRLVRQRNILTPTGIDIG